MEHSKLSEHSFIKGKFITPLNSIKELKETEDVKSWTYGRLPEYLWIGIILNKYGRKSGLEKIYYIIEKLHEIAPDITMLRMSEILKLEQNTQRLFYEFIIEKTSRDIFSSLTLILTFSKYQEFSSMFCCPEISIEERQKELMSAMRKIIDHQTNEATDIRFVVLYFFMMSGKMHMPRETIDTILSYPQLEHSSIEMRTVRPTIRAIELTILEFEEADVSYLNQFWGCISEMTKCSLFAIKFPNENSDITLYCEKLYEIYQYLSELYVNANPLDEKMSVIIGIATYSYKRFKELCEHKLFNTISGRSCIRVLIENYIMIKYLIKQESNHENIWKEYKLYGVGLYKLVLSRHREKTYREKSHFDMKYIEGLVNEFKEEEFIDMDTRYFGEKNIRLKAEEVDEKDLYGLYYDYDSSYEHGLWGAIRESSLVKCDNPAHQFHCVPDIEDETVLKSVLPDCVMAMNKTIKLLHELYGIPMKLFEEVISFEI